MNNSPSMSSSFSTVPPSSSSKSDHVNKNKDTINDAVTINEKVILTKQQHQVLKIICDTYEISLSEYMQQALVEAMRFDIEEGNFSDALLEKIGCEDSKKDNNSPSTSSASLAPDLMKSDLDLLKKLQTQMP
jgi:anti-sigma28 factor (negative regulator of flagellin synthesis)